MICVEFQQQCLTCVWFSACAILFLCGISCGICHMILTGSQSRDVGWSPLAGSWECTVSSNNNEQGDAPSTAAVSWLRHVAHLCDTQCWLVMKKKWTGRKEYDKNEWYGITETVYNAWAANMEQSCLKMLNRWHRTMQRLFSITLRYCEILSEVWERSEIFQRGLLGLLTHPSMLASPGRQSETNGWAGETNRICTHVVKRRL